MANLTIGEVIEHLTALTISGIKTIKPYPPSTVTTAQLPFMFFRSSNIAKDDFSLTGQGGLREINVEALVLIEASRQSTLADLYGRTRTIMDNIAEVLETQVATWRMDSYTIRETSEAIQDTDYSAIVVNMSFS